MSRSWKEPRYLSKEAYMPQYKGMPGPRCRSGWLGDWAGGYGWLFGWHWKSKWWKYIITFWKKINEHEWKTVFLQLTEEFQRICRCYFWELISLQSKDPRQGNVFGKEVNLLHDLKCWKSRIGQAQVASDLWCLIPGYTAEGYLGIVEDREQRLHSASQAPMIWSLTRHATMGTNTQRGYWCVPHTCWCIGGLFIWHVGF